MYILEKEKQSKPRGGGGGGEGFLSFHQRRTCKKLLRFVQQCIQSLPIVGYSGLGRSTDVGGPQILIYFSEE